MKPLLIILCLVLCGCDRLSKKTFEHAKYTQFLSGVLCAQEYTLEECDKLYKESIK